MVIKALLLALTGAMSAEAPDQVAQHLSVLVYSPDSQSGNSIIKRSLTSADLAAAQSCKDRVLAGKRFPRVNEDEPVPPSPGIDPRLYDIQIMINRCLVVDKHDWVTVMASTNLVKPLLH